MLQLFCGIYLWTKLFRFLIMAEGPSEEEYDWSDYVSSDSDAGADPYRDDPQWTDQCANACDVVGSLGRFAFSFSNCFVFSITCFSNFFGGVLIAAYVK